jgi:UDP:flavonoid glycosyltransferase YjiC (YdhE family)
MTLRVLFTSTPGTGHLHPLVPLADACVRQGHEVRWAVASDGVDRVRSYGFDAIPAGMTIPDRSARFAASVDLSGIDRSSRPVFFKGFFADAAAPVMREQLGPVIDEFRPDVMVHELCELATPPVASARGIPYVTVAFSGEVSPELIEFARPSMDLLWASEGLPLAPDFGWFEHLYLHPWPAAMGHRPWQANVAATWHMGFDGGAGDAPQWTSSLGAERPCVYVTFGTEVGRIAPWPAILDSLAQLDVDAVITTGSGVDLAPHGPVPANVRVEQYVPQRFVLDRASLVVSHCGSGTLAAAMERGLPQVALPLGADQFENARASAEAGLAVDLAPTRRSADDIAAAMQRALTDAALRARCDEVRDEVSAMPLAEEIVTRIMSLVG